MVHTHNEKDITNPRYVGPGTWDVTHREAFHSKTREQQLRFIDFMKRTCKGFPCKECSINCTKYIENHPMEDFLNRGELGMFIWSWMFHNTVNTRLGKSSMDFDTAYNRYSGVGNVVCTKGCADEEVENPERVDDEMISDLLS